MSIQQVNCNGQFTNEELISNEIFKITNCKITDLDSNGDMEILVASSRDQAVYILDESTPGEFVIADTLDEQLVGGSYLHLDYINEDALHDLVQFTETKLYWRFNDASGLFGPRHKLSYWTKKTQRVIAADADLDGDQDIVTLEEFGSIDW